MLLACSGQRDLATFEFELFIAVSLPLENPLSNSVGATQMVVSGRNDLLLKSAIHFNFNINKSGLNQN